MLFFWNLLFRVGLEQNETIIFIFSLSQPFPTYFCLKLSHMGNYYFYVFCCYFYGIFNYASGRNETELQFLFSLFLCLFQPILAWNEATTIFFNFLAILLEFSITRRVGTERNDNFYFLSFSAFSILFWLEMKPQPYFFIFFIFWLFYWNFLLRVGLERNGTIIFIFLLSQPSPTYFGLKWILNDIF